METYLVHHGIKGQKWGVRRFQNSDGTLTPAGRERYSIRTKISERGNLTYEESMQCRNLGKMMLKIARKEEPKITKDIIDSIKNTSSKMYGLEHRLKTLDSLSAKIGSESKEKDITFRQATGKIKDAVRYTTVTNDNDFVNNYRTVKKSLEQKGYTETKCKNYFDMYKKGEVKHKSVQCNYKTPDGYEFEIQFQTPSSQKAKDLKVPLYEERRKLGISESRAKELENKMVQLAEQVTEPKNISKIKSH